MAEQYEGDVSTLEGQALDYWMYQHASAQLKRQPSLEEFESGYANGQFHFSSDKALLADMLERYDIRLQMLGNEWLASTQNHGQFGEHPLLAACRLVVNQHFGQHLK